MRQPTNTESRRIWLPHLLFISSHLSRNSSKASRAFLKDQLIVFQFRSYAVSRRQFIVAQAQSKCANIFVPRSRASQFEQVLIAIVCAKLRCQRADVAGFL